MQPVLLFCQNKGSGGLKISSNYHQGFIIPEFGLLDPIDEQPLKTIEISLSRETNGKNQWSQLYNYPEYGINIYQTILGQDEILGRITGADYFFRINFIDRRVKLYNRTAFGINYASKIYDEQTNPLNISLGAHFNFHFNMRFGSSVDLTSSTSLNLGVSLDHFSNANTAFPNLGLNTIAFYGGIAHYLHDKPERNTFKILPHSSKTYIELMANFGMRNMNYQDKKYFFTPSASIDLQNETFRLINFGIGMDVFYDESIKQRFINESIEFNPSDSYLVGLHFSQAIVYNRFKFILQEGFYLKKNDKLGQKIIYNRAIFKYNLTRRFSVHLSLKSHVHNLEYNEVGIGYKL